ncbi:MAG: hypothetical protein EPO68_11965 [Planctomycetota bacterium]|nr:MAG: hypothetical protein EPO68_11965 [Planctomycetota bacterium]
MRSDATQPENTQGDGEANAAWEQQLRTALELIAARLGARRGLQRAEVRTLLLPLGALLADHTSPAGAAWVQRIEQRLAKDGAQFRAVVESELQLAAAEYVQGVDPRYLGLPGYDFEYTLGSREGLEARRLAAEALSVRLPDATLKQIELADQRLEAELERRGPQAPSDGERSAR